MALASHFGAFLVKNKVLSQGQVEEAILNQGLLGGRLGTNLVEIGCLSLDELENQLARFLNVPRAMPQEFETISQPLLQSIPRRLIDKYFFLPLNRKSKELRIATANPKSKLMCAEIEGVLAVPVVPCVSSEIRLIYFLSKYFNLQVDMRFRSMFMKMKEFNDPNAHLTRTKEDLMKKGFRPLDKGEELTSEDYTDFLMRESISRVQPQAEPNPPPPPPAAAPAVTYSIPVPQPRTNPSVSVVVPQTVAVAPAPVPQPVQVTIADLQAYLPQIQERNQIADWAVRYCVQYVEACVMFTVNSGLVSGWDAKARHPQRLYNADTVKALVFPLETEGIFQTVAQTRNHFLGRLSAKGLNQQVLGALGIQKETNVLVIPVFLKKRLVNFLLMDIGAEPLSHLFLNALLQLGQWLPGAYEHLILQKKQKLSENL